MITTIRKVLALAMTGGALVASAQANAQGKPVDTSVRSGPAQARELEEIIVTAQRREQRVQDVPISITVLGGEQLDRSTSDGVTETLNRVPGVSTAVAGQGGGTIVTVRGVSASGPLFAGSSPNAYYLDSVPFGLVRTGIAPDASAYDLQRVEVLRGPQGTLYGATALNGVVRVLTADANLEQFELKARTSGSSTQGGGENYRGDIAVNVPIVDEKVAARAVFGYQDLSGWIDRPNAGLKNVNDSEILNGRLKINARPTENLSVGLLAWFSRGDYGSPPYGITNEVNTSFVQEPMSTDYDVYGLKVGYDFSAFSLSSMTSYVSFAQEGYVDLRTLFGTPPVRVRLLTDLDSEVLSQEFLLSSRGTGNWRWSFGGMYRDAEDRNYQFRVNRIAPINWSDTSESFAAFGELTRLFLDGALELTAGLRYYEDKVSMHENQKQDGSANPLIDRDSKFDTVTPRVVVTTHPSEQLTVYASYAEGFRSGFDQNPLALTGAPQFPPVVEDTLRNYELGTKGTFADGRVSFEGIVYYTDWEDIQQFLIVQFLGANVAAVANAKSASGVGVDFAFSARPADWLQFGLSAGWNDLTFDSDVFSVGAILFAEGDRPSFSPEYTAGAFADLTFGLGGGYDAQLSVSGNYVSEQATREIVPGPTGPAVTVGDNMLIGRASLSINSPARWAATIFVDNVTNEDGAVLAAPVSNPNGALRTRPRTIGAQLEYNFR
jgi:iron complex outermembrane recepter protein